MKVSVITGSFPPDVCGVGDYTYLLIAALNGLPDVEAVPFYRNSWKLRSFFRYRRELKASRADIFHLQYPTEGYGYSFLPLLLAYAIPKRRLVVTIHELSSRTSKAIAFSKLVIARASVVILTTQHERKFLHDRIDSRKQTAIIGIGSNIPVSRSNHRSLPDRPIDLAYFGHIRPNKGMEEFLQCARGLREEGNSRLMISIIGQTLKNYRGYGEQVRAEAKGLGIRLIADTSSEQVADELSNVKCAYLPYPDGISSRRGSMIACLLNGVEVISHFSSDTPVNEFFSGECFLVGSPSEAGEVVKGLVTREIAPKNRREIARSYSWPDIARRHFQIYHNMLNGRDKDIN